MVVVLWGVNTVSIKYLTQFFPPTILASIRMILASSFLFTVFLCKTKQRKLPKAAWGATAGVAISCIFLHQIALTIGLKETSSTHATLILGLGPLFTTVLASFFLREPFTLVKGLGIFLGLCGIGLIVVGKSQSGSTLFGDGITCIAALTFAIGSLFVKKAVLNSSSLAVTAYSHTLAAIGLTAFNLLLYPVSDYAASPMNGTILFVLSVFELYEHRRRCPALEHEHPQGRGFDRCPVPERFPDLRHFCRGPVFGRNTSLAVFLLPAADQRRRHPRHGHLKPAILARQKKP